MTTPGLAHPRAAAWPLTKIVATIGPASNDPATLAELCDGGVSVVRLNFSHGTHADHAATIARLRTLAVERGQQRPIAILQDLQGPKLRVGELAGHGPVLLTVGAPIEIVTSPMLGTAERISTTYTGLGEDVHIGDRILLDDGAIEVRVERVERGETDADPDTVTCRVIHGGLLKPHKGINLPGTTVNLPALTEKDRDDLAFGIAQGVDLVALSFVRTAADLRAARAAIRALGGRQPLIAKIEKPQAIDHLPEIIRAADGVMVARGDLGVELSPEAVPMLQKRIIALANQAGIPVITATQMLESMMTNPRPTRAEASDVANAVLDGTDAVMLSGETAVGAYPVEAVRTMARIALAAERSGGGTIAGSGAHPTHATTDSHAVAHAARSLGRDLGARAIAVLTATGRPGGLVSGERPGVPIVAFTERGEIARRLAVWHGVLPIVTDLPATLDDSLLVVERELLERGLAAPGEKVIVVGSAPRRARGRTPFVQVHRLPTNTGLGRVSTRDDLTTNR